MITSRVNPRIKELAKLAKKPLPAECCLAEGAHLAQEILRSNINVIELIVSDKALKSQEIDEIYSAYIDAGYKVLEMSHDCYQKISLLKSPEGIAVVFKPLSTPLESFMGDDAKLLIAAGVQDPGNAGAIVRVAEAAGASGCIFLDGVDTLNGKFLRAAMGSSLRVPCIKTSTEELITALKSSKIKLLTAHARSGAVAYDSIEYPCPVAICLGSEGLGITPELCELSDKDIIIPMEGKTESLNVSVAAGIILYQARRSW